MLKLGPTYRGVHWMGGKLDLLHRYPTLLGSTAYMKVLLQGNTNITQRKHSECTCSW